MREEVRTASGQLTELLWSHTYVHICTRMYIRKCDSLWSAANTPGVLSIGATLCVLP